MDKGGKIKPQLSNNYALSLSVLSNLNLNFFTVYTESVKLYLTLQFSMEKLNRYTVRLPLRPGTIV
jgi:hypothetical protein